MSKARTITQERLKELFHYDPETGVFTRLTKFRGGKTKVGTLNTQKRLQIKADWIAYTAHRLAWLYMTGDWPKIEIDHIDGNPLNNCFANLREATKSQNHCNKTMMKNNKSGVKGVRWERNKWRASIIKDRKKYHLGVFDNLEDAAAAYAKAAPLYHGQYARIS